MRPPDADPPAYPRERFTVREGWRLEVLPLSFARGRIVHTDGEWINAFW